MLSLSAHPHDVVSVVVGGEGGGEVGEFRRPSVGFVVHTASLVAPNEVGPSL